MRQVNDWTLLPGASIEIRQQGRGVWNGLVDAVTDDGDILWVPNQSGQRRPFEKAELYEAWATEERDGFHYEVTKSLDNLEKASESGSCADVAQAPCSTRRRLWRSSFRSHHQHPSPATGQKARILKGHIGTAVGNRRLGRRGHNTQCLPRRFHGLAEAGRRFQPRIFLAPLPLSSTARSTGHGLPW